MSTPYKQISIMVYEYLFCIHKLFPIIVITYRFIKSTLLYMLKNTAIQFLEQMFIKNELRFKVYYLSSKCKNNVINKLFYVW